MALKHFNPTTPSQRNLVIVDRSELWKGKPVKKLTEGLSKTGGRNNTGRTTAWHRGGGHKRRYRMIDFKRQKFGMAATVERLEYDPNRSAFIALVTYEDGEQRYILAPQRVKSGDVVYAGPGSDIKPGNALPLRNIPVGTIVHNVELKAGKGGQLARSAGTYVQFVGRDGGYTAKIGDNVVIIPTITDDYITPYSESFQALIWHCLTCHPKLSLNKNKWESIIK